MYIYIHIHTYTETYTETYSSIQEMASGSVTLGTHMAGSVASEHQSEQLGALSESHGLQQRT